MDLLQLLLSSMFCVKLQETASFPNLSAARHERTIPMQRMSGKAKTKRQTFLFCLQGRENLQRVRSRCRQELQTKHSGRVRSNGNATPACRLKVLTILSRTYAESANNARNYNTLRVYSVAPWQALQCPRAIAKMGSGTLVFQMKFNSKSINDVIHAYIIYVFN